MEAIYLHFRPILMTYHQLCRSRILTERQSRWFQFSTWLVTLADISDCTGCENESALQWSPALSVCLADGSNTMTFEEESTGFLDGWH